MTHWTKLPLCRQGDNGVPDATITRRMRIAALREYRDTGEINRVWLCTPEQLPEVSEIDWTGFPASIPQTPACRKDGAK